MEPKAITANAAQSGNKATQPGASKQDEIAMGKMFKSVLDKLYSAANENAHNQG